MKNAGRTKSGIIATLLAATILPLSSGIVSAQNAGTAAVQSPMAKTPEARRAQRQAMNGELPRVFGGTQAAKDAWPFQVALLTTEMLDESDESQFDAQFCGGSLISSEWVLTAAHCLVDGEEPVPAELITVLVGATALTDGTRIPAAEVIVNANYSMRTLDNDIGLIRLASPAKAPAIRIADAVADDGTATVIGWGRMEDGNFPANLMQTEIELKPNDSCNSGMKEIYRKDLANLLREFSPRLRISGDDIETATAAIAQNMGDPLTENMLCAGTESGVRDACNGDSGGPLFTTDDGGPAQVGIVSWGDGPLDSNVACGHRNAFGVYTRISRYRDWIREKTGL